MTETCLLCQIPREQFFAVGIFFANLTGAFNTYVLLFFRVESTIYSLALFFFFTLDTSSSAGLAERSSCYIFAFVVRSTVSKNDFTHILGYLIEEPA